MKSYIETANGQTNSVSAYGYAYNQQKLQTNRKQYTHREKREEKNEKQNWSTQ